jgi:hypothetical protein
MEITITTQQARKGAAALKQAYKQGGVIVRRQEANKVAIRFGSFMAACDCPKCMAIKSVLNHF